MKLNFSYKKIIATALLMTALAQANSSSTLQSNSEFYNESAELVLKQIEYKASELLDVSLYIKNNYVDLNNLSTYHNQVYGIYHDSQNLCQRYSNLIQAPTQRDRIVISKLYYNRVWQKCQMVESSFLKAQTALRYVALTNKKNNTQLVNLTN